MSLTPKEKALSEKTDYSRKAEHTEKGRRSEKADRAVKKNPGKPVIINVISGKGGTGKTLFTATVANAVGHTNHRVLVIDLDLFVRGMTVMSQGGNGFIVTNSDEWTVMSFFRRYKDMDRFSPLESPPDYQAAMPGTEPDDSSERSRKKQFCVKRYYSFDLLPAVERLTDYGDPDCLSGKERAFIRKTLDYMIQSIQGQQEYEYIFLDSRAGYDKVIAAAHDISKFSIIIEDDDRLSSSTTLLLGNQLKDNNNASIVLRVRNKVRRERQMERDLSDYEFMGDIPFDLNVVSSYGNENCLNDVEHTEYKKAVVDIWNNICRNLDLNAHLKPSAVRKNPAYVEVNWINGEPMKKEPVLYSLSPVRRAVFSVSLPLIVAGLVLSSGFAGTAFFNGIAQFLSEVWQGIVQDPSKEVGVFLGLSGLIGAFSTLLMGRRK